jgi:CheY-like chemotaxis protein
VLVVDDEPCLLELLGEVLREALKARVFVATDSIDALRLIFQSPPDLIISDIVRPGLDGIEFTRRVRRFGREMPVLIISGGALPASADDARAAGASACMAKPFALHGFLRLVRRLMVRRARLGARSTCLEITPTPSGRFRPRPPTDRR